ncbi:MAG: class I SAM-dependent methyltransferase, partial [Candidatus Methanomethylophilaceae archaeon]|nr:class I SAM-dependent methyltransferase [Candidatus Methanomethylophilaceae archaeon]
MDWELTWMEELEGTTRRDLDSKGFWDDKVGSLLENRGFGADMTRWQLSVLDPSENDFCIYIGCGCGRLTIPVAKMCKGIMALDGSGPMQDELSARVARDRISNITVARSHWQEYEPTGRFDLTFASFSMFMRDMRCQLLRMSGCSDRCVVFASADLRIPESAQRSVLGRIVTRYSDAEMIFGIAEDAGLEPELETEAFEREAPGDPEKTIQKLAAMCGVGSDNEELKEYVFSGQCAEDLSEVHAGAISWRNRRWMRRRARSSACTSAGSCTSWLRPSPWCCSCHGRSRSAPPPSPLSRS